MKYEIIFHENDASPEVKPSDAIGRATSKLLRQHVGKPPYTAEVEARAQMLCQGAYLDLLAARGRL
jgi:hypothetical protein